MKLVSVIVPCHNRVVFLLQCLSSIDRQTYPAIEIIIVDDASDEDVKSAVAGFKQQSKRAVKYTRSDVNVGPGQARELGRRLAKGAFICYQDSDDLWHPEKIQSQVECLEQHPNAGMCYCTSREFKTWPLRGDEPIRRLSDQSFTSFFPMLLELRERPWGTGACMWTRIAIEKIGPWFPGWEWEDMEYDSRAGCYGIQIVHINKDLCYYRSGDSNEQLRKTDEKIATINRTDPIISIGHHLKKHKLIYKPRIAIAYGWMLYDHAVSLLKFGETHLSANLLQELIKFGSYPFYVRQTALTTFFLIKAVPISIFTWMAGRIVKYCRVLLMKLADGETS